MFSYAPEVGEDGLLGVLRHVPNVVVLRRLRVRALFEQLAAKGVDPVSALSDPWGDGDGEEGGER